MAGRLMASVLLGLALVSVGCSERRMRRDYERVTGHDERRGDRLDINAASARQLSRLPGLTDDDADRIVANRPYPDKEALVRRGVIGPRKFESIEDYVYAGGGRRERRDEDRYRDDRYYDDDRYDHRY